jgi:hypothetical protein
MNIQESTSLAFSLLSSARAETAFSEQKRVPLSSEADIEKIPAIEDAVQVNLSAEASSPGARKSSSSELSGSSDESNKTEANNPETPESDESSESGETLSEEEKQEVQELKQRDREVKTHEQAHAGALGAYKSGGPNYEYTSGPDGKRYATSGSVGVDLSPESTPEATIRKMQTIRSASLAPAEPSGADRQVAAKASQIESGARKELQSEGPDAAGDTSGTSKSSEHNPNNSSQVDSEPVAQSVEEPSSSPSAVAGVATLKAPVVSRDYAIRRYSGSMF